jgi:hypothetical protein
MDATLAKEAAEDLAYAKLNPQMVKFVHETERSVFDGYENVTRKGVSKTGDKKTESEQHTERAKYRDITDHRIEFMGLEDQIKLQVKSLMELGQGYYEQRTRTHVTAGPIYSPMLKDPWPEYYFPGCARIKLQQGIAQSQARPEFTTPVNLEESWQPTTTPSATSGMIKSSSSSDSDTRQPPNNSSKRGSSRRKNGQGGK